MGLTSVFFFSSRRRHTRFDCDWSSDVCSSDLGAVGGMHDAAAAVAALAREVQATGVVTRERHAVGHQPIDGGRRLCKDGAHGLRIALACARDQDRKSTRLNSSHSQISYAVFCLKKKKKKTKNNTS